VALILKGIFKTSNGKYFRNDKSVKDNRSYRYYVTDNIRLPALKIDNITSELISEISSANATDKIFNEVIFNDNVISYHIKKGNPNIDIVKFQDLINQNKYKIETVVDDSLFIIKINIHRNNNYRGDQILTITDMKKNIWKAFAIARKYLSLIENGYTIRDIELECKTTIRSVYRYLNLNFLSPIIVNDLLSDDYSVNITLDDLFNISNSHHNFANQEKFISIYQNYVFVSPHLV